MKMTQSDFKALNLLYSKITGASDLVVYVVGGKEGNRFTYCGKLLISQLVEHYSLVPNIEELPPYLKLQRELVKSRSTGIRQYLIENDDHIFPEVISIAKTIIAERLEPACANFYKITIPKESFRYLIDGQGRLIGSKDALALKPSLAEHTIDIKFILSETVQRDSQIFADVNSTPIAPNKSQCAAMDGRLVVNQFAKRVIFESGLNNLIDFSKASVTASSTSSALWTLNQFKSFVLILTGTTAKSCQKLLADEATQDFWAAFISKFFSQLLINPHFAAAYNQTVSAPNSRLQSIVGTSVFLKSIGLMAKVVAMNFINNNNGDTADWSLLDAWSNVDLSLENSEWIGRCMSFSGRFEDRGYNHRALASYFLLETDFEVPEELEEVEEEVLINRAGIKKLQREAKKLQKTEAGQAIGSHDLSELGEQP